jgi:hypothetical protein
MGYLYGLTEWQVITAFRILPLEIPDAEQMSLKLTIVILFIIYLDLTAV